MKTILFPTDFSAVAENALEFAVEFSKKIKAELILYHADFRNRSVVDESTANPVNVAETLLEASKTKLNEICLKLTASNPGLNCRFVVEEGLAIGNIVSFTNKNVVSLVIMGTSGASGLEEIFEGSNTMNVAEDIKCPLLAVPKNAKYTSPRLFVYALDLIDEEARIIDELLQLTSHFNAELELLHVNAGDTLELVNSERSLKNYTREFAAKPIRYKIIDDEDSLEGIEKYAERADILVLALHHRSFFEKLFSRNRVPKLAYHTEIPLLIVHKSK
jgi:nucleotide-binding universal stress UspA family protein